MRFFITTALACFALAPITNALLTEDDVQLVPREDVKKDTDVMCAPLKDKQCVDGPLTQAFCADHCWCQYGSKNSNGMKCSAGDALEKDKKHPCNQMSLLSYCQCVSKPGSTSKCDGTNWVDFGKTDGMYPKPDDSAYNCPKGDKDQKGCVKR